jgi:hypothetical protein
MAYKSMGISIFILLMMASMTIVNLAGESMTQANHTNYFGQVTDARNLDDTGLNSSLDSLHALELMDNPLGEFEREGGEFNAARAGKVFYDIVINATTGFASFWKLLLGINPATMPLANGLIEFIGWMVILNHAIAILQLTPLMSLGGKL